MKKMYHYCKKRVIDYCKVLSDCWDDDKFGFYMLIIASIMILAGGLFLTWLAVALIWVGISFLIWNPIVAVYIVVSMTMIGGIAALAIRIGRLADRPVEKSIYSADDPTQRSSVHN